MVVINKKTTKLQILPSRVNLTRIGMNEVSIIIIVLLYYFLFDY